VSKRSKKTQDGSGRCCTSTSGDDGGGCATTSKVKSRGFGGGGAKSEDKLRWIVPRLVPWREEKRLKPAE
jgi:hypothetical protein